MTINLIEKKAIFFFVFMIIINTLNCSGINDENSIYQNSQTENNRLANSYKSSQMRSLTIMSNEDNDAIFKFGSPKNSYSFSLEGKQKEFSISHSKYKIVSITNNDNILIYSNDFSANKGMKYTGNFTVKGVNQWTLVHEEDFSQGASGWSHNIVSSCGGVFMLGGYCKFGKGEVSKIFSDLPKHSHIRIEATYHFIDAWNGESGYMKVDNGKEGTFEYVWIEQYSAFLGDNGINICGGKWPEGKFASPIDIVLPHSKDSISLIFGATIEQDPCDESFGVSGIRIYIR